MTSHYRVLLKFSTKKNAFMEGARAELLYTREMLAVSFDRLVSHFFLVVGHENHRESFVVSCMWNVHMCIFEW